MIKRICFIVPGYPAKNDPSYQFVGELIRAIADRGVQCNVIAPQSVINNIIRKKTFRPKHWVDYSFSGQEIEVYQPYSITFSNLKIGKYSLSNVCYTRAIVKKFKKMGRKYDVLYAHFWDSGVVAGELANLYDIPFVVASGESVISVHRSYPKQYIIKRMKKLAGVIAVSTKNKEESLSLELGDGKPFAIIPNAIDTSKFKVIERQKVRKQLNIPSNIFVIGFVGSFIERKGPLRLLKAVQTLEDDEIGVIFIGGGSPIIDESVIFSGKLNHSEIPHYLNACDVFVLPTLAEGCSNAIVEAMACGLPVVSSNLPFNKDILDNQNSILVDPLNINELAMAIKDLKENPQKRKEMSVASLKKSQNLTLESRAQKILDFIYGTINKN